MNPFPLNTLLFVISRHTAVGIPCGNHTVSARSHPSLFFIKGLCVAWHGISAFYSQWVGAYSLAASIESAQSRRVYAGDSEIYWHRGNMTHDQQTERRHRKSNSVSTQTSKLCLDTDKHTLSRHRQAHRVSTQTSTVRINKLSTTRHVTRA